MMGKWEKKESCKEGKKIELDFLLSSHQNCDVLSKPRKALPNLVTDEPVCPDEQLQCGDGVCMDKLLFCNGKVF